jgi:hypothetical protein
VNLLTPKAHDTNPLFTRFFDFVNNTGIVLTTIYDNSNDDSNDNDVMMMMMMLDLSRLCYHKPDSDGYH